MPPSSKNKKEDITPFEFEMPLISIEQNIEALKKMGEETGLSVQTEIDILAQQAQKYRQALYKNLHPADRLLIARHIKRPNTLEIMNQLSPEVYVELCGNRTGKEDLAMVGGIIELDGQPVVVVGTQKGGSMKDNLKRNFGMASPEGYQKALRLFYHANKFGFPILTLIDTPGAYPGMDAEQHGIGFAIAQNLREMARLRVPIISIVTGEGASGGALGIGVANHIYMQEHAVYTVISPEGCASILWRSAEYARQAAESLKITANDLLSFGLIEGIIAEPMGGAHHDPELACQNIKQTVLTALDQLKALSGEELVEQRYQKFRKMGVFEEKVLTATKK